MLFLIVLVIATYFKTFTNGFISDDITINSALKNEKYPLWSPKALDVFTHFFDCLEWRLLKENKFLHHIVSVTLFALLSCSFYIVAKKFIPEPVAFTATIIFIVHPCNTQSGGWISAKWWGVSTTIALWGVYFNNIALYIFSAFFGCSILPFVLPLKVGWIIKLISVVIVLFILKRGLSSKVDLALFEGEFKREGLQIHPRKIVVSIKSFCYYFTLAFFPVQMGWFHEMGEPIDDKLRSFDFHFVLCLLLIATLCLFIPTKAFLGLLLFVIFIAPFCNIVTLALFTSERYMIPAMMGWSIFLGYLLVGHPIILAVVATIYFMRTQLQLWAFKDDFHLALSSLINFPKSGYAWTNLANMLLSQGKPSAAYDLLMETSRRIPNFPTTYWLLYVMYRSMDLLNDFDKALMYLEKAVYYGKHKHWIQELDNFKNLLRQDKIVKFKGKYVNQHPILSQLRPPTQQCNPANRSVSDGNVA